MLRRQRCQHIGMEVNGPVINDDIDRLGVGIGGDEFVPKAGEASDGRGAALAIVDLPGHGIQGPKNATICICAMGAIGQWLGWPLRLIMGRHGGLAIKGQFIQIEQHRAGGVIVSAQTHLFNQIDFGLIVAIRAMDVMAAALVMNA